MYRHTMSEFGLLPSCKDMVHYDGRGIEMATHLEIGESTKRELWRKDSSSENTST